MIMLNGVLDQMSSIPVGGWSVMPTGKCVDGITGLRNIGATCYMNAVLQQIMRIPAFQFLFLRYDPRDSEGFKSLRVLLHFTLYSQRRWCDTQAFRDT